MKIALFLTLLFFLNGCIVTDEIKFKDRENSPPELISYTPANDIIRYAEINSIQTFNLTIYDKDEDDLNLFDGRIFLIENINSSTSLKSTTWCEKPKKIDSDKYDEGVLVSMKCQVRLRVSDSTIHSVLIQIAFSDKGYMAGDLPAKEANSLLITWSFELIKPE
jgi:hypothetical protein